MYLHDSINTGRYTTSTTNMYHKDRFHVPSSTQALAWPKFLGVTAIRFIVNTTNDSRDRQVIMMPMPNGLINTMQKMPHNIKVPIVVYAAMPTSFSEKSVTSKKTLVLILLVLVVTHHIKIKQYMFV